MTPLRLYIKDFCSYAESEINFNDFSSALIVGKINGSTKHSNGSGKSTIFAAIEFVLFNEIKVSSLEKNIRDGADFCKVEMDFVAPIDNETYRVVRIISRKSGSDLRLFKLNKEEWEDKTQRRNSDTEKEIEKILKTNYKTFCASALFSQSNSENNTQKDYSNIAALTPERRKAVLKEAFQLNVYSNYEKFAKKKVNDLIKEIEKNKTILSTIGDPNKDIINISKILDDINKLILEKEKLLIELAKQEEDAKFKINNFNDTIKLSHSNNEKKKILISDLNSLNKNLTTLKYKFDNIKFSGKKLSDENEVLINKVNSLKMKEIRDIFIIQKNISDVSDRIIHHKSSLLSLNNKKQELELPMPVTNFCKHCRSVLTQEHIALCKKDIENQLIELHKSLSDIKSKLDKDNASKTDLENELTTTNRQIETIKNLVAQIESNKKELESKRNIYTEYSELISKCELDILSKTNELNNINNLFKSQNIDDLEYKIKELNRKIHDLGISDLTKNITLLKNQKAVEEHKLSERNKDLENLTQLNDLIKKLEDNLVIHNKVVNAFGSNGIPALIVHNLLDEYQEDSNFWLSKLRHGFQLKFSVVKERSDGDMGDTLDISYIIDGAEREYKQLSGAQKLLASLSLKLGLGSVLHKKIGSEVKLLMLDEIDQALDEGSIELFTDAIRELQKYYKILIITHNNDLKDKFSNAILVEQNNQISTAKITNIW